MTIPLLPPPLYLDLATSSTMTLPTVQANLMPFHIDYSGPAPIDAFLVLRQADTQDGQGEDEIKTHAEATSTPIPTTSSLISAFRGRTIQSTQLPLPSGYVGRIVHASTSSPGATTADVDAQRQPSKKAKLDKTTENTQTQRKKLPPPPKPKKMQRFSMDSDDDDEGDEQDDADPPQDEADEGQGLEEQEETDASPDAAFQSAPTRSAEPRVRQTLKPVAELADDALRVWGPDGPIDRGDDVFFRTIEEWAGVVCAELHAD